MCALADVCDIPAAGCKVWATDHCFADDSVTWVAKRAKKKRITAAANEAAQQGRVPATREEANRRFAEVSAAEARQRQSDEEANQNNQDHAIEDEDTEETFSTYEPFHFKRGQVRSFPASACWRSLVFGLLIRRGTVVIMLSPSIGTVAGVPW